VRFMAAPAMDRENSTAAAPATILLSPLLLHARQMRASIDCSAIASAALPGSLSAIVTLKMVTDDRQSLRLPLRPLCPLRPLRRTRLIFFAFFLFPFANFASTHLTCSRQKNAGLVARHKREVFNFEHYEPQLEKRLGVRGPKLSGPRIATTGTLARTGGETFPTAVQPVSLRFSSASAGPAISPWLKAMRTTCAVLLTSSLCLMLDW